MDIKNLNSDEGGQMSWLLFDIQNLLLPKELKEWRDKIKEH